MHIRISELLLFSFFILKIPSVCNAVAKANMELFFTALESDAVQKHLCKRVIAITPAWPR